jgi:CRISPR-associated endoribonuclease Cas6
MRFNFTFELENEELNVDYRRKVISFLKQALEKSDKDFYKEMYGKGVNSSKDFTMAVYFVPETQVGKENILVKSRRMIVNLSTADSYIGIKIYNAVCGQKHKWYKLSDGNQLRVININQEKEKIITQKKAYFNTLSPIVIRDHDRETGKDWFYTFEDDNAADILIRNLENELGGKFPRDISYDVKQLKIDFLRMKKIIVKNYNLKIPCSLGILSLEGEQYLLQYLYQRGIGSKRGLCFGYVELL